MQPRTLTRPAQSLTVRKTLRKDHNGRQNPAFRPV